MNKHVRLKTSTSVPIYDCGLWLVVAAEPSVVLRGMATTFPNQPEVEPEAFAALHVWAGSDFGLFFRSDRMRHSIIAHEILHSTHRIMEYIECPLTSSTGEPFAYLNAWIHNWVYSQFKKAGIRVSV